MANWGYVQYTKAYPNKRKVFKRIRRIRRKNLCVYGEEAKRLLTYSPNTPKDIKVCLSRLIIIQILIFYILSIYIIWDGLSQKTISRYCPFNYCDNDQWTMPIPGGFLHSSVCWTCRSPSWLTSGWPRGCLALLAPQQLPWVSPGQQLQQLFGRVYLTACAAPHLHFRTVR